MLLVNGVDTKSDLNYLNNNPTHIIDTQTKMDAVITRTAANAYKIDDAYTRIFVKSLSGGYDMTSFLSGGDTWGYIKTNNCVSIEFEQGAIWDYKSTQGYLWVDTNGCFLNGVDIQGSGTGGDASAIKYSYYNDAYRVTYWRCRTSNRYSNYDDDAGTGFCGFFGNVNDTENLATSAYYHCSVYTIDATKPITGMKYCYNNYNSYVFDLDSSGSGSDGTVIGFHVCRETVNPHAWDLEGDVVKGMSVCVRSVNGRMETLDATSSHVFGYDKCNQLSNCQAIDLDSAGGTGKTYGFYQCNIINACEAKQLSSTTSDVYGFRDCDVVSSCYVEGATHTGSVAGKGAYGFAECQIAGACWPNEISTNGGGGTAEGFKDCTYMSSVFTAEGTNSGNDYVDTADDQITNKVSSPSVFT